MFIVQWKSFVQNKQEKLAYTRWCHMPNQLQEYNKVIWLLKPQTLILIFPYKLQQ